MALLRLTAPAFPRWFAFPFSWRAKGARCGSSADPAVFTMPLPSPASSKPSPPSNPNPPPSPTSPEPPRRRTLCMSVDFNTNAAYCRHVLRRRALHCLAVCFLGFLSGCPSIQAQEATLESVATDLSEQLSKTKQKHFSPKILVTDFPLQSVGINSLGETLASQLSDALVRKLGSASVIDRNRLHGYLQAKEISPFDLGDSDIAAWIAGQIGATAMVFGKLTLSGEKLKLSADLIRLENGKKLASSKINLPLTDELRQLTSTPLAWSSSPDVFMPCRAGVGETTLDSFKAAGLTMPTCIHCPDPTYTDEAR